MSKPKPDYSHIPQDILSRALKHRRPPIGTCECGRRAYFQACGDHICESCVSKQRHRIDDISKHYGIAGSNIHRQTGKHVDTHAYEPYSTAKDRIKSNVAKEINRHGMY